MPFIKRQRAPRAFFHRLQQTYNAATPYSYRPAVLALMLTGDRYSKRTYRAASRQKRPGFYLQSPLSPTMAPRTRYTTNAHAPAVARSKFPPLATHSAAQHQPRRRHDTSITQCSLKRRPRPCRPHYIIGHIGFAHHTISYDAFRRHATEMPVCIERARHFRYFAAAHHFTAQLL